MEKPLRLSEAIRLGSMLAPQTFGKLCDQETESTCALGAAIAALRMWELSIEEYYSWGVEIHVDCPACKNETQSLHDVIMCLNTKHRWTREAIADWVETLEDQEAARQPVG